MTEKIVSLQKLGHHSQVEYLSFLEKLKHHEMLQENQSDFLTKHCSLHLVVPLAPTFLLSAGVRKFIFFLRSLISDFYINGYLSNYFGNYIDNMAPVQSRC